MSRKQRGLGLLSLLLLAIIVVSGAVLAMKVFPTVAEYLTIKKAIGKAVQDGGGTVPGIRASFDRTAAIDDIRSISGKDLDISKDTQGRTVAAFKYEKKLELFGPASLLLEYEGRAVSQ
jgi:hypothetical protein